MDISAAMIKDRLLQQGCKILKQAGEADTPLSGVKLFDGDLSPDYLTIGYRSDLQRFLPEMDLPVPEENRKITCILQDMFFIVDDLSLPRIFNMSMGAFQFYRNFESDLMRAVYKGADMQGLLDIAEPYFDNPAFIANWHGEVFAFTKGFADADFRPAWSHIVTKRRLPLSSVQVLRNSPHYYTVTHSNTASIFRFPEKNFTCIIGKLDKARDFHLYLQVMQYKTPVNETTRVLATAMIEALAYSSHSYEATSLSELFCDLLNGTPVEKDKIAWVLAALGWEECEKFLLLSFWNSEGALTAEVLCGELKNFMTRGYSFIWREHPVMLIRESDLAETIAEIRQLISELSFVCGVSMPFSGWDELDVQFIQAEAAIRYCKGANPVSLCADHVWTYLTEQLEQIANVSQLYHPAVIALAEYDQKKGSQLLYTLYAYLANERSLSVTAEKLFVHRNTLLHRLSRIRDVVPLDLDNMDMREHIMLSYRMLESAGRDNSNPERTVSSLMNL